MYKCRTIRRKAEDIGCDPMCVDDVKIDCNEHILKDARTSVAVGRSCPGFHTEECRRRLEEAIGAEEKEDQAKKEKEWFDHYAAHQV